MDRKRGRSPARDDRRRRSRSPGGGRSRSRSRSRSRDRKRKHRKSRGGWDQAPDPVLQNAAITNPAYAGLHPARVAQLAAMNALPTGDGEGRKSNFSSNPTSNISNPAMAPALQASRQARRLYVGGLLPDTKEEPLRVFFCEAMMRSIPNLEPGEPVVSVYLNLAKKFGFVEFRNPEEATLCLQLDGIRYNNQPLKIRRPSDYQPPSQPSSGGLASNPHLAAASFAVVASVTGAAPPNLLPAFNALSSIQLPPTLQAAFNGGLPAEHVSNMVADGPNKVYCGGLPQDLTEEQVRELITAFGPLKSFHLPIETATGKSRGFCFFEYVQPEKTDEAIAGLHNLEVQGKRLTVKRAQPPAAHAAAAAIGNPLMALVQPPSRVIQLLQMVTPSELEDDQEYKDILEDVESECRKFGNVLSVTIPRGQGVPGVGKVYVEFDSIEAAGKARADLEGRQFASRIVMATFFPEDKYNKKDFS